MALFKFGKQIVSSGIRQQLSRIQPATRVMLFVVGLVGILIAAWFTKQEPIARLFWYLNHWQRNPSLWLKAPMMVGKYLLLWTTILLGIVWLIMKISPIPRTWSRTLVVGILAILTVRYLLWRSLTTLNLSNPLNGVFSLGLFLFELLLIVVALIQLILLLRVSDRRPQADRLSQAVIDATYRPTVDILVPTYNEPIAILRRTIIGCQALAYEPKKIYLLDDTDRDEVAGLAAELGCEYIARPEHLHAKAGNLNYALSELSADAPLTNGELVAIFDADFIPTTNFLTRTIGFFQDDRVGLVQTPQTFYNSDPIARNLGLENILTPEEEVFYRQIQPMRDGSGGVVCAGTSFVVRRSALAEVGYFVTESLSEDFFTGIRLAARGYRLIYLNEKLSAGLAAESIADRALQQVRWAQGTLQAFFINANPLTIRGLRPLQRLAYLEGLLHWFTSVSRVFFLLMPLTYSFLGVIPFRATGRDLIYFFMPYYLVNLIVFSWLNQRSRSALLADIYSVALCFPLARTVISTLLNPFGRGFKVTPKGTSNKRFSFNWQLALPLIILFMASAFSFWNNLGMLFTTEIPTELAPVMADKPQGLDLGILWSIYNLMTLGIALLILVDVPRLGSDHWFDLRRTVRLKIGKQIFWGTTIAISEAGADVILTQKADFPICKSSQNNQQPLSMPVELEILEEGLVLLGNVTWLDNRSELGEFRVLFDSIDLVDQRRLVEMLFCRPGQWQSRRAPGELRSLWLFFRILLKPKFIFDRRPAIGIVSVNKESNLRNY